MLRKEMSAIKNLKVSKKSVLKAIRIFSLSVGSTGVCILLALGLIDPESSLISRDKLKSGAVEASLFNGASGFSAHETMQTFALADTAPVSIPDSVIPLGTAFGIRLMTDGVIVSSLSDIYTPEGVSCPAAEAGIKAGDYLLEADGMEIQSNSALAGYIGKSGGNAVELLVKRGDKTFETSVRPVFSEGSFKTGMWVRDSAAGVGTLTYYDPQTGIFAGLGHGICDMDTKGMMSLKTGEPAPITLCGIIKGEPKAPGQLKGYFTSRDSLGALLANNECGVFGTFFEAPAGKAIEVARRSEAECGGAQILCTLDETGARLYDVEIERIASSKEKTKNLIIHITDPALLDATGGIIQGMSGSPVIQNGKLIAAVTHVFVDDPSRGYGIFIENMLKTSSSVAQEQSSAA